MKKIELTQKELDLLKDGKIVNYFNPIGGDCAVIVLKGTVCKCPTCGQSPPPPIEGAKNGI